MQYVKNENFKMILTKHLIPKFSKRKSMTRSSTNAGLATLKSLMDIDGMKLQKICAIYAKNGHIHLFCGTQSLLPMRVFLNQLKIQV